MILSGSEIRHSVVNGSIKIDPFAGENVGPNSYDFRLGYNCAIYRSRTLDAKKENKLHRFRVDETGILLSPDKVYLFNTYECMGSDYYVPIIRGRSSVGRLGLFIDVTADLIDIGSINNWTLQLHCISPIRVYPEMLIGQVTFWAVQGEIELYSGKYAKLDSPVGSLSYLDFLYDDEDKFK